MGVYTGGITAAPTITKLVAAIVKTWTDALAALTSVETAYTPALTGVTLGNGTLVGKYTQVGKHVEFSISLTFGSTTVLTAGVAFGLPVTAKDANWSGVAYLHDSSTTTARQPGCLNPSTTVVQVYGFNGQVDATHPITWATSDVIKISGTYEAA